MDYVKYGDHVHQKSALKQSEEQDTLNKKEYVNLVVRILNHFLEYGFTNKPKEDDLST